MTVRHLNGHEFIGDDPPEEVTGVPDRQLVLRAIDTSLLAAAEIGALTREVAQNTRGIDAVRADVLALGKQLGLVGRDADEVRRKVDSSHDFAEAAKTTPDLFAPAIEAYERRQTLKRVSWIKGLVAGAFNKAATSVIAGALIASIAALAGWALRDCKAVADRAKVGHSP
jgi:hypothetical protein